MALSYISADGIVEITIENTTTKGLLLPLGQLGAQDPFSLILTWDDKREFAIFTGGPSATPGRFYPFVVPLLPGSRYVVRRPSFQYRLASKNESLGKALLRHPALRVDLVTESAPRSIDCFPASSFWTGTLVSNSVRVE